MAPKKSAAATTPAPAPAPAPTTPAAPTTAPSIAVAKTSASGSQAIDQVAWNIVEHYQKTTPQRTKLLDVFMAFLVVVGGLQFAYCVLAGNYVCTLLQCAPGGSSGCISLLTSVLDAYSHSTLSSRVSRQQLANSSLPVRFLERIGQGRLIGVLTMGIASLRIQTTEANKSEFPSISPERYASYLALLSDR